MKIEEKIVSDLAFTLKKSLTKTVIKELKEDIHILLEEHSCLDSRWEEFCVVTQDEHSFHIYEKYKTHILNLLANHFNELSAYEKIAIWLKSEEGVDWLYDNKLGSVDYDQVPVHFADSSDVLFNMIEEKARVYDTDNIYRCIYLNCKEYAQESDFDDREVVYE